MLRRSAERGPSDGDHGRLDDAGLFEQWAERAEEFAIGRLGLTYEEFEALTPREQQWRVDGYHSRELEEWKRTAQLACWVMNPWLKQPITIVELLNLPPEERPDTDWLAWSE